MFVTGFSIVDASVSDDYATIAYQASTGARKWLRLCNGPGDNVDDATALAVSPASGDDHPAAIMVSSSGRRVFVTGQSLGARTSGGNAGFGYATVGYAGV